MTTLIRSAGDDPDREGLIETTARVVCAYEQWFAGYGEGPDEVLQRTFEEVAGYDASSVARHSFRTASITAPIVGRRISIIDGSTPTSLPRSLWNLNRAGDFSPNE